MVINGIAMQGHPTHDLRVKKYKLQYSDDLVTWKMYIENNVVKVRGFDPVSDILIIY